ncbi:glycolate oxidase subunit GlcE [Novosphingobium flavum]|uniref:Glycolate oxidase subunit GlcE n=1 Tax=Novosphingobium flavum TaxID=1778672 RepID=A0A7X1FPK5_9SPHN|nr:glycolate oxidase subunit GlcE [Novosphingobium flavum]MBC2664202.1 glycolate oxidase subunit GlcE [Novosphingobium flavum]
MLRPSTIGDLCEIVADGGPLRLRGGGSKDAIGSSTEAAVVDMRGFCGVADYDPPELVLTVGAGTPLAEVEALVAAERQMLAFDPVDHAHLLGGEPGRATIGGIIAAGVAGPARLSRGAARDHVLGFTAVSGRGEAFVAGAKVVKNVTGYDLPKLVTGSWGRLAALTQVTLKVLPAPETSGTVVLRGQDAAHAQGAMARAMGTAAEVSAAAHLPDWDGGAVTALRLDGFAPSVRGRIERLKAEIPALEVLEDGARLWEAVRHATTLPRSRPLWRCIVPARQAPVLVDALPGSDWLFDWAGGLVWLATEADPALVRSAAEAAGGHAMLVRASAVMRAAVPALHPQPAPLAALEERVRRAFDPAGVFETGRF